jgi:predicted nucleic acid-binding protein
MNFNNPNTVVITDTSCLIILNKVSSLNILYQLFTTVITTPEIAAEYGNGLPEWITVQSVKQKELQKQFAEIVDMGEASAIALAHEIENNYIIIDDIGGRKLCTKLGLPFIGTFGLLIKAKEQGVIAEIKQVLDEIRKSDFRMTDELYLSVLKKANEL